MVIYVLRSVTRRRLMETENSIACATVNCKLCKSAITLYLSVIKITRNWSDSKSNYPNYNPLFSSRAPPVFWARWIQLTSSDPISLRFIVIAFVIPSMRKWVGSRLLVFAYPFVINHRYNGLILDPFLTQPLSSPLRWFCRVFCKVRKGVDSETRRQLENNNPHTYIRSQKPAITCFLLFCGHWPFHDTKIKSPGVGIYSVVQLFSFGVTPCSPLKFIRRFGGACRLHLRGWISQARNHHVTYYKTPDMFLRKAGWLSPDYVALHPRR
jgi:hypothetical protein